MSSNRSKLTMDEQSFQDMLAAAYTIQEHNAKRKRAPQPEPTCGKCGAAVNEGESLCPLCAAEEVRPGEKLQQKWATMWLMGQEQGLFPEPTPNEFVPPSHESSKLASGADEEAGIAAEDSPDRIGAPEEETPYQESLQLQPDEPRGALSDSIELSPDEVESAGDQPPEPEAPHWPLGLRDLQLKLRFHRADLYLVAAIIVSTFAMLWVLLATPAPGVQNKPRLRPWERAMISLGLAEAPDPPAQRGNPNAQVWVDPKTALYYCYGDDQYGKTPGGRQATQREAQLDSFQPASRAACE